MALQLTTIAPNRPTFRPPRPPRPEDNALDLGLRLYVVREVKRFQWVAQPHLT